MDDFDKELKIGFLDEAAQGLADTEQCFLALESNTSDVENLNRIFRLAHNLKGSSKAVGFDQMGQLTHEFETFILKVKNGTLAATPGVVSVLLECNDFVASMVNGLRADLDAKFDIAPWLERLSQTSFDDAPVLTTEAEADAEPVRDPTPSIDLVQPAPVIYEKATLAPPPEPRAAVRATAPSGAAPEETMRVSVAKIEALLNSIGEMVILQSVTKEQAVRTESLVLRKTLHQLEKVTKEVQDISMSMRMVPVKPTFQKMQRIVRDTAIAVGKDVNLTLVGEETEVDKTVLEKINDPLVHLVRNSVDHGIESSEARLAAGKPAKGNVTLSAYHRGGKLFIDVSDDGGGLDSARLIAKAIEKGVIKDGAKLSKEQGQQLIFAPGFSTKDAVTDVSGRGVGMDVVKTNIHELGGEIAIHSELGQGTKFQIALPLTLAIIDGMTVVFGNERFVVPFSHVFETMQPKATDIQSNEALGQTLMLRGENMPIYRLGDFFGRATKRMPNEMIALVIRMGATPFALLVDDVLGHGQVVVKQLGPELRNFKGVSGCTILGDGKPALIIESIDLVKRKLTAGGKRHESS